MLPPEGGEKDTTPPVLRTELSTPDQQTNFRPTEIRLVFDEWIQLKDPLKQVVISPPLKKAPLVTSEGKAVVVQFNADEPWKDSTTYTLQFGKAITDRNEGNVTPDVRYVFSTGPVIDSLSAGGVLLDARSRAPVADALGSAVCQRGRGSRDLGSRSGADAITSDREARRPWLTDRSKHST